MDFANALAQDREDTKPLKINQVLDQCHLNFSSMMNMSLINFHDDTIGVKQVLDLENEFLE